MLAHNDAQQHLTAVSISQQRYLYLLLGAGQLMDAADSSELASLWDRVKAACDG